MNLLYKILIIIVLILALTLSFAGCDFINSGSQSDKDKNEIENPDNEQLPPADEENGGKDEENTDKEDGNGENEPDDGKTDGKDEVTVPEDDSPYLQDTELPHFDYADTHSGKYNSKLFYANDYDIALGDPTVFYREEENGGWFYVTGTTTGQNFDLWRTRNFIDWGYLGKIYTPPSDFFGADCFWAPQISYDAEASHKYYLGEGDGKGLYILCFSSRASNGMYRLGIAFSKNIEGPYTHFKGTNANGDYIDASKSCFEIEKLKGLGLYSDHVYGDLYKAGRGFIDASAYVDPVSGDKYLYMVRNRSQDTSNDVWGVKMKDWVTPDYSTTTPLSSYGYTTVNKTEKLNFTTKNKIDEGPFLYYKDTSDDGIDNGKYYLTLSIGDTNDKLYPVCQAIGDTPLGPFTKLQPEDGGFVITPGDLWNIHSSGHHCFFEAGDELFVGYHTYTVDENNEPIRRYFGMAKVEWVYNSDSDYIMRANGPSKDIQPLPEVSSEYKNIADKATVKVEGKDTANTQSLTDGLISLRDNDCSTEFEFKEKATLTFDFKEYVTARAILIYNSYDYDFSFDQIDRIEVSYRKIISGKYYYGKAYIEDLGFDFKSHLIPQYYLLNCGETNMNQLRPTGAAIAEFYELEINSLKIELTAPERASTCRISEIMILGTERKANISYSVSKKMPFLPYSGFTAGSMNTSVDDSITFDGKLDESIWTDYHAKYEISGLETDTSTGNEIDVSKYGERKAEVYSYIGDKYVYFAIDVTDKNLFYHSWLPQGRSSAVELYMASGSSGDMDTFCYSIRINPIADGNFKLGIYTPNSTKNEWTLSEMNLFGKIKIGLDVKGEVVTSTPDENYDRSKNQGYTVEIAIDKALIGGASANNFKFTAAFVQMKEYNQTRMGNSFIDGTSYVDVTTWKAVIKPEEK